MASLDFPASPTTGQLFTGGNGVSYRYDGTLWLVQAGPGGGTGDFCAISQSVALSTTPTVATPPVVTGNSGLWYNVANGRYTPPAGRYKITGTITGLWSGGAADLILYLRKNGAVLEQAIDTTGAASQKASATVDGIFDANGSDFFDWQVSGSSAGTLSLLAISSFPLTGMQGPAGPPPLGSLSLYSEQVLVAPSAQLAVTFPAAAKLVELVWDVAMTPASDILMALQGMVGATPNASAGYTLNRLHSSGTSGATSVTGDLNVTLTAFNMQAPSLFRGKATFMTPSKALGVGQVYGVSTGGVRTFTQIGFEAQGITGLDGYRLFCASNNFAAGSFLRCLVVV